MLAAAQHLHRLVRRIVVVLCAAHRLDCVVNTWLLVSTCHRKLMVVLVHAGPIQISFTLVVVLAHNTILASCSSVVAP